METELKELELHELMATKDVIVLTSSEEAAVSWLIECHQESADIQIIENAHELDTEAVLAQCRNSLSESKKVILTAQFRSQLPIINLASLCNEKRKLLINIELLGWDEENRLPHSFSSF
ncbi:Unknow protein [Vibrio crassostreae]|nr:Unknow protein [Vibrio crassostreae]CAK3604270.1 Unknow protein [Vibrio crassostreae]CAK3638329.1 Unknow protein [Vibrio crassostreae]CAK3639829.1 Unknow protein [Vibrio crassostreae]CAK3673802.1 Unknow protein [Vibrio crassostreae]